MLGGFWFIVSTPSVWLLSLVPGTVALGVTGLLSFGGIQLLSALIASLLGPEHGVLAAILKVLAGILAVAASLLLGYALAQPLSGPALNRIVRRVELGRGAPDWPATGFWEDMGRALSSVALSYTFGLPLLALLAILTFVFPAAAVVTFPLKVVVLALLIAWDLFDYPLSIHGLPMGARLAFIGKNLGAVLGFGFGLALLSLIPCALFIALPAGVAGAARLTLDIERANGDSRPGARDAKRLPAGG